MLPFIIQKKLWYVRQQCLSWVLCGDFYPLMHWVSVAHAVSTLCIHSLLLFSFLVINLLGSTVEWQIILNWSCFNFTISSYCYTAATFLPHFPSQLDVFTSQVLISKTLDNWLPRGSFAPPSPSIYSASLCLLFSLMRSCSYHSSLGVCVIQAQTEGSQTSVRTWDQDSRGHVSTHCPWDYVCVGVSAQMLVPRHRHETWSLAYYNDDNGNVITLSLGTLLKTQCHEEGILNIM